ARPQVPSSVAWPPAMFAAQPLVPRSVVSPAHSSAMPASRAAASTATVTVVATPQLADPPDQHIQKRENGPRPVFSCLDQIWKVSARRLARRLLDLIELFEEIKESVGNGFLLDGRIESLQLGGDLIIRVRQAPWPAPHTGTALIFRDVTH